MTKFNISNAIAKADKEFGLESGAYLKIKEGNNKIRLLSETVGYESYYKGNRNVKFICWVLDYVDGKVKLYFMPFKILKSIEALQIATDDYRFDEVPMPYDITINATNAGTKEVNYSVLPARANSPIEKQVLDDLNGKASIADVIIKLKENDATNPDKQPPTSSRLKAELDNEVGYDDIPVINEDKIDLSNIPL